MAAAGVPAVEMLPANKPKVVMPPAEEFLKQMEHLAVQYNFRVFDARVLPEGRHYDIAASVILIDKPEVNATMMMKPTSSLGMDGLAKVFDQSMAQLKVRRCNGGSYELRSFTLLLKGEGKGVTFFVDGAGNITPVNTTWEMLNKMAGFHTKLGESAEAHVLSFRTSLEQDIALIWGQFENTLGEIQKSVAERMKRRKQLSEHAAHRN